jgi:hypothetical protein
VTGERQRLLTAIGDHGAEAEQLSELGPWAMDELEKALADQDVTVEVMPSFADTTGTRHSADPHSFYVLTEQGAAKAEAGEEGAPKTDR